MQKGREDQMTANKDGEAKNERSCSFISVRTHKHSPSVFFFFSVSCT